MENEGCRFMKKNYSGKKLISKITRSTYFELDGDIKIEYNEDTPLKTRKMPHRYVWCYKRKNG